MKMCLLSADDRLIKRLYKAVLPQYPIIENISPNLTPKTKHINQLKCEPNRSAIKIKKDGKHIAHRPTVIHERNDLSVIPTQQFPPGGELTANFNFISLSAKSLRYNLSLSPVLSANLALNWRRIDNTQERSTRHTANLSL